MRTSPPSATTWPSSTGWGSTRGGSSTRTARSWSPSSTSRACSIETPVVVNACGAWAPELGKMVGVDIPIDPIRRQVVVTAPIPDLRPDFTFVIFFADSLYFHREGPGILTGQSNNDETPGFKLDVDQEWEARHVEAAVRRFPRLGDAGFLTSWAGLYEVTPDAHPILGRVAAPPPPRRRGGVRATRPGGIRLRPGRGRGPRSWVRGDRAAGRRPGRG